MPALTKKKKPSHRTSTGRRASGTGRAKKAKTDWRTDSEGYRIHHKIVDSARAAGRALKEGGRGSDWRSKTDGKRVTKKGKSKGGRGSEKKK